MPCDCRQHHRKRTHVTPFIVLFWIATVIATFDALRRPAAAWVAADRGRGFWVTGLVISSLMLFPAIVFLPAYVVGVLPWMSGGKRPAGGVKTSGSRSRPLADGSVDEFRRR